MQTRRDLFFFTPPDVIAASLEMLDARDLLLLAVGLRRPLTALLPRGWAFQACRPLTEAEQTGLVGVGVPRVILWPECPTLPVGLTKIAGWTWCHLIVDHNGRPRGENRSLEIAEDASGKLYVCRDTAARWPCWETTSETVLDACTAAQPLRFQKSARHADMMKRIGRERRAALQQQQKPAMLLLLKTT